MNMTSSPEQSNSSSKISSKTAQRSYLQKKEAPPDVHGVENGMHAKACNRVGKYQTANKLKKGH